MSGRLEDQHDETDEWEEPKDYIPYIYEDGLYEDDQLEPDEVERLFPIED